MPKVSIIIPVYGVEKYLRQCLDSVVGQTLQDIEIIVVDDGSPDKSYKIYQEFAKKDDRVRFTRKENGGVAKARNIGFSMAKGDYVIFIDSDDWMTENACELLYNEAVKTNADLVVADVYVNHENGVNERIHLFDESFVTEDQSFIREYKRAIIAYPYNPRPYNGRCICATGLGGPWNKLIRKSLIDENNLSFDSYVKGIYDDCLFSLEVLAHVKKMAYVQEVVYYYRLISTSLIHKYKENTLDINHRIFERIEDYICKYESMNDFKKAYSFYVIRRLHESFNVYFFAANNPNGILKRLADLKEVISQEPYKSASDTVDLSILNRAWKMNCVSIRRGSTLRIYLIYNLKKLKLRAKKES